MTIDVAQATANLCAIDKARVLVELWYERYNHAAVMLDRAKRELCDATHASRGTPRCVECPSHMCRGHKEAPRG